jgi:hypothetical protein
MAWSYEAWCKEQSEKLTPQIAKLALGGIFDAAVFVQPSNGATQGELILSTDYPPGMLAVLRFGTYGSRVSSIPRSHLTQAIWNACRNEAICPIVESGK